ncbi:MAG: hypothetical protein WD359_05335 [Dehalococcoidia bacterium]
MLARVRVCAVPQQQPRGFVRPPAAAACSGMLSRKFFVRASMFAPPASNASIAAVAPKYAAKCSAVNPSEE